MTGGLNAEAARLAAGTMFSRDDWLSALTRIGNRKDREELIRVIHEAAVTSGSAPGAVARILLGDETSQGMIAAYAGFRRSVRELGTAEGVGADELSSLADGIVRLSTGGETGENVHGRSEDMEGLNAAEGREETVRCLLVFGDQAELVLDGADPEDVARWPAGAIAADTGLRREEIPGRRFRVRVSEPDGRVVFSGFRLVS